MRSRRDSAAQIAHGREPTAVGRLPVAPTAVVGQWSRRMGRRSKAVVRTCYRSSRDIERSGGDRSVGLTVSVARWSFNGKGKTRVHALPKQLADKCPTLSASSSHRVEGTPNAKTKLHLCEATERARQKAEERREAASENRNNR